ncbi:MAG: energy transducer TonB [Pseudomonadota bacterium]
MTLLLSSFQDLYKARAAVVLVVALHGAVLFGFAQYSRAGHALKAQPAETYAYQPIEVVFVAPNAPTAEPAVTTPVTHPKPPQEPRPQPSLAQKPQYAKAAEPAIDSPAQPASALDAPSAVATPAPASTGTASHGSQHIQASKHVDATRAEALPLQAAKPDYAYNPQPDYPLLLREQGVGGVVWLRVWVDSEGLPGEIKLAKGSGYRLLDDAALRAVRQWRFMPAKKGDQNLASWVEFPIRFTLNG